MERGTKRQAKAMRSSKNTIAQSYSYMRYKYCTCMCSAGTAIVIAMAMEADQLRSVWLAGTGPQARTRCSSAYTDCINTRAASTAPSPSTTR